RQRIELAGGSPRVLQGVAVPDGGVADVLAGGDDQPLPHVSEGHMLLADQEGVTKPVRNPPPPCRRCPGRDVELVRLRSDGPDYAPGAVGSVVARLHVVRRVVPERAGIISEGPGKRLIPHDLAGRFGNIAAVVIIDTQLAWATPGGAVEGADLGLADGGRL